MAQNSTQSSLLNIKCVRAKSLQSCPTVYNPMDYILPGSSVHGILQARIVEWVAISFSISLEGMMLKLKLQYFGHPM